MNQRFEEIAHSVYATVLMLDPTATLKYDNYGTYEKHTIRSESRLFVVLTMFNEGKFKYHVGYGDMLPDIRQMASTFEQLEEETYISITRVMDLRERTQQ